MAILAHTPEISTVSKIFFCNHKSRYVIRSVRISSKNEMYGTKAAGVRIFSRMKDCEVVLPELDQDVRRYRQFSAPVQQCSKPSKEEEEKQNYYVNMGYAIRILREEFPGLFYRELNFDIYRDDIVFKDPLNTFTGIQNYKSIFWALRFHGRMFFNALWVDIISVWQPMENVIMIRWTMRGIPRLLWESHSRFDGISEYKLDKKGKIFEHRVDNIALNSPPKFRVLTVEQIIQSLGCPSTPRPTCFENYPSSSSSNRT